MYTNTLFRSTHTHFFARVHIIWHVYKCRRALLWFFGKLMVERGTGSTALSMGKKCCCLHVWVRCRWTLPKGSNTLVYATLHRAGYAAGVRGGVLRVMLPGTILNKSKYCTVWQTQLHRWKAVVNEHVNNYAAMVLTGPKGVAFQRLPRTVWFP